MTRSILTSLMVLALVASSASAERWLIERGRSERARKGDRSVREASAELLLRAKLSQLRGVTLLSKVDVKSDVVTLELNRLSSAKGKVRVRLGKFARARGLIVVEVTGGGAPRLALRVIDLTQPARDQSFVGTLGERSVSRLAEGVAAFLGRRPTADEIARMRRPTQLTKDALVALAKSIDAKTAAERELFTKLATTHAPKSSLAWYLHARALHASGRALQAISAYRRAVKLEADQTAYHYDLGNVFFDEKRYAEAVGEYARAIGLDFAHEASHENYIRAMKAQGKMPAEILLPYSEVMGVGFDHVAVAHLQTGRLRWEMGKRAIALVGFRRATELEPSNPIYHFNYAHALERTGKVDEAIDGYRRAIELAPNYAKALNNLAFIYEGKGRNALALFYYQQAVKYAPDYALAWNNLGILYGKRGRHRLEVEAFRKQTKLTPKDAVAWFNLGVAWHRLREPRSAIAAYKKSLDLNPTDKLTHWQLAQAYERLALWNLSTKHWRKVLTLSPSPKEKSTAEKHIRENEAR